MHSHRTPRMRICCYRIHSSDTGSCSTCRHLPIHLHANSPDPICWPPCIKLILIWMGCACLSTVRSIFIWGRAVSLQVCYSCELVCWWLCYHRCSRSGCSSWCSSPRRRNLYGHWYRNICYWEPTGSMNHYLRRAAVSPYSTPLSHCPRWD